MKARLHLLVCLGFCFFNNALLAQSWNSVGPQIFADSVTYPAFTLAPDGTPYVIYGDCHHGCKTIVKKFDGSNWVAVGDTNFSSSTSNWNAIAINSHGIPYISFSDAATGQRTEVRKLNGTSWSSIGANLSPSQAWWNTLAFTSTDTPYLMYYLFAGSYADAVLKYNGSTWQPVGNFGATHVLASWVSFVIDKHDIPYALYSDALVTAYNRCTVVRYKDTGWTTVGNALFSDSIAILPQMTVDNNQTPYAAYTDSKHGQQITVQKLNGATWAPVGPMGMSFDSGIYVYITTDAANTPYVAYADIKNNAGNVAVRKFDGTSWVAVGNPTLGLGTPYGIKIDKFGNIYVLYNNANKLTMLKYGNATGVSAVGRPTEMQVYPNPAHTNVHINVPHSTGGMIILLDHTGKLVKRVPINNNSMDMDISDLAAGSYILELEASDGSKSHQQLLIH